MMDVSTPLVPELLLRDARLLKRHQYGDPCAFEEIYSTFSGMVYNLALRLSGSREDAQDLTQEVFLRIFRGLGRFRGGSSLKTWIYRVSINHCRSRLGRRRLRLEPFEPSEPNCRPLADPCRGPEDQTLQNEAERTLIEALARVDAVYREALVLRDIEELSYEEIANVLRVRIGTVRSRIARGREQLRRLLERPR
jgi:RNA polymerase sigma-70 factor (ECF subfamily)